MQSDQSKALMKTVRPNQKKYKNTFLLRKFLLSTLLIAVSGMMFSAPLLAENWKKGRILVQPRAACWTV